MTTFTVKTTVCRANRTSPNGFVEEGVHYITTRIRDGYIVRELFIPTGGSFGVSSINRDGSWPYGLTVKDVPSEGAFTFWS